MVAVQVLAKVGMTSSRKEAGAEPQLSAGAGPPVDGEDEEHAATAQAEANAASIDATPAERSWPFEYHRGTFAGARSRSKDTTGVFF